MQLTDPVNPGHQHVRVLAEARLAGGSRLQKYPER